MQNYIGKGETFLIGLYEDDLICTGGLIEEDRYTGRIVRMSVKKEYRRKGVATVILKGLEKVAKEKGYNKIVLETTEGWSKAINLYKKNGYTESKRIEGNVHLVKKL
nr:GNAT family N-acetyltransferase [Anaeromonas gelatinilytica]